MFQVVLYRPEIPPNTGNVIRMCANTGATLHLIHPLGFSMDDARLRRAGLDYREYADVTEHPDLDAFLETSHPGRLFALSGSGSRWHTGCDFRGGDAFLFGPESVGLDNRVLTHEAVTDVLRIPMLPQRRSLNLANSVAIVLFEAWRQLDFPGGV
ncbi:MAG: tRNA (cytidine(34)-2'-O)-methyltransferase [bacterium]|nr:tRNA (cytidine(34)-2'-O)-methyltransferase [bacterium]MDE0287337.1 tRNA (cytidine(34)-2'-O)-methyltransferase [bacterium]MDE0439156.1 tRNA (cytidine(34)-2'-O)-methyltransferase [bacterium]